MGNILVITGVTGKKSGGAIAQILSNNKEDILVKFPGGVKALIRGTSDTSLLDKLPIHFQKCCGELTNSNFLEDTLKDVDTVLHVAGISLSAYIVDAAVKCGVRRLILVHTTGIYSKYKTAGENYRITDAYVEKQCKEHGILLTILHPTMIYGNVLDNNVIRFVKMVDKLPFMPVVNGANYALQPVHYMDLAQAYYDVLMNEASTANRNFNLSGGEEILLRDMLIVMGENLGKKVKFISCPFFIAYAGSWVLYIFTFGKKDYREKVQRLVEPRVYSHQEATNAFGYSPRTFRNGIVVEIEEYKNKKYEGVRK
ncbi:MAG: NmrA family NAD(P)-binding protein [Lachnospiraceae bacterium]|nr:NmrA family NAD(P)-binding protein [Lachnospiraceae bacterium]MCC8154205.1 NmrA family NAD(P)-binding protein [Tannerellaceae bacterium]